MPDAGDGQRDELQVRVGLQQDRTGRCREQVGAVVILGGLVTVTLLDQIFTPALFYRFGCPPVLRAVPSAEPAVSPAS